MDGRSFLTVVELRFARLFLGVPSDDVKFSALSIHAEDCVLFGRESGDAHVCASKSVAEDPFDRLLDGRKPRPDRCFCSKSKSPFRSEVVGISRGEMDLFE